MILIQPWIQVMEYLFMTYQTNISNLSIPETVMHKVWSISHCSSWSLFLTIFSSISKVEVSSMHYPDYGPSYLNLLFILFHFLQLFCLWRFFTTIIFDCCHYSFGYYFLFLWLLSLLSFLLLLILSLKWLLFISISVSVHFSVHVRFCK